MKKQYLIIGGAVLVLLLIAVVLVSTSFRTITVVSGKQFVDHCPRFARPGEEVTVTTVVVSDGELYVNGVDTRCVRPGEYVFTMPEEDVLLRLNVIAYSHGA